MGTRNLTCVFMDGKYKVAQYGQFDGYPEGQGKTILHFLRDKVNWLLFTKRLEMTEFIEHEKFNMVMQDYGSNESGFMDCDQYDKVEKTFPEFHRNTAADILELIQNGELITNKLLNNLEFAANSSCEWCYVIDIDKGTFEVYEGYNTTPLTPDDRFYFLKDEEDGFVNYKGEVEHAVKLKKEYKLSNLPTDEQFILDCDPPVDK